ncbi:MAG: hypothetical protein IJ048_04470 [Clostridia bacterium]|nr:hypothetical protein [Clostridia bacterium]
MNRTMEKLLNGGYDNHILPFLWLHGEDEATLREYMRIIHAANIGAVCVESRPHPDFGGPKWWRDMDIILDEARRLDMKVWILDDSHFPTGFAAGKMMDAPEELCRQCLVYRTVPCPGTGEELVLDMAACEPITPFVPRNDMEKYDVEHRVKRVYQDDRLLGLVAVKKGGALPGGVIDLSNQIGQKQLRFRVPEGEWTLYILHLTRNRGARRHCINMMSRASCRIQIDAVYEPHWQHYSADFGKTIAGFFSDEPELGNGHLYEMGKPIWRLEDQAWSDELQEAFEARFGEGWIARLPLLWEQDFDAQTAAETRLGYMDIATRLVEQDFSEQLGGWCRAHGVQYIGHLIEDQNQHFRTGCSLGHYFRGLGGQDMAGIDDIGGQVLPQGEWDSDRRSGRFYHFVLGRLAASQAVIDPIKHGDSMCEIFGAYGWQEGVRLEKYLADHFLMSNVNHFVPHAFSAKAYPDPDCPPHFYAHGNNPQYRHFGALMLYMNRVCTLLKSGAPVAEVAVLYGAESDWMGRCMMPEDIAEPLARRQISYDFVPADVFSRPERFNTELSEGLSINGRRYKALILPACERLAPCVEAVLPALAAKGVSILDAGKLAPADMIARLDALGVEAPRLVPENPDLRALHIRGEIEAWMLVNEGAEAWTGEVRLPSMGPCVQYDAWENGLRHADAEAVPEGSRLCLRVEPLHSVILLFGYEGSAVSELPGPFEGNKLSLNDGWTRSVCRAINYPRFEGEKPVCLPDSLAEEMPRFSGFARYERMLMLDAAPSRAALTLTDAYEGVELFVNGTSCGIQIAPPYRYEIAHLLRAGENALRVEVATTLERENAAEKTPGCASGINGRCELMWRD